MNPTQIDADVLIQRLRMGLVVHGPDTEVRYANPRALELLRISMDQALGRKAYDEGWAFLDGYGRPLLPENYPVTRVQRTGEPQEDLEVGITDGTGRALTWVLCSAYPEFAADDPTQMQSIVVTFYDITRRKKVIPFENIVEVATDAVVVTEAHSLEDQGPKIVYVNAAFSDLTGFARQEVLGQTPRILQGPETDRTALDAIKSALIAKKTIRTQLLNYRNDSSPYWIEISIAPLKNEFGEVAFYAAIERDITDAKERELNLRELSVRDPLTGLHNRRGFMELAEQASALLRRGSSSATVAVLDVDHFKVINDTHGHAVGDLALKALAGMLLKQVRASDVLGRMGGEEFALLLASTELEEAWAKMDRVRAVIAQQEVPIGNDGQISFTVSVGLASIEFRESGEATREAIEAALATADAALYRAKLAGRNRVISSAK